MLDRVDARPERRVDSVPSHRVSRDSFAKPVGFAHQHLQLFVGEVHPGAKSPVRANVVPPVRVELDPVRAVLRLLSHGFADFLGSVDDLDALRHLELPRIAEQGIGAGRGQCARGDEHPRAWNHTARDCRLHIHVRVHRALGLDVAYRRESVHQSVSHRSRRADRAVGNALLQELIVVVRAGDVALKEHVRVIVDQSGQNRRAAEINDLCSGRNSRLDLRPRSHGHDSLAFDNYRHIVLYDVGPSIDHVSRADNVRASSRLGGGLRRRQEWKREQKCECSRRHLGTRDWLSIRRARRDAVPTTRCA